MGLTMKERASVTKETAKHYKDVGKKEKQIILDEYVKLTGFARKYAICKLNSCIKRQEHIFNNVVIKSARIENPKRKKREYIPKYGKDVLNSLTKIWRTFDFMCGQRLIPFIRENLDTLYVESLFEITSTVYEKLKTLSSATANRLLKSERQKNKIHGTSTTKAAGNLNKLIPIRAYFDWDERVPGFFEMDTVAHDGGTACGEYCFTLDFTDVCTGWTVLYALLNKAHRWVKESSEDLKKNLPYSTYIKSLICII